MTAIPAELLEAPDLPAVFQLLETRLSEERKLRRRLYRGSFGDRSIEIIQGRIIELAPMNVRQLDTRRNISLALSIWCDVHELGKLHCGGTLCVFPRNDYEPDVCFFGPQKAAYFRRNTMKFPPPDFICEVLSKSTEARDRGIKFKDYAAHGVREYWIADPRTRTLEQYVSDGKGGYKLRLKSNSGEVESTVIKGFRIPIRAIFDAKANAAAIKAMR